MNNKVAILLGSVFGLIPNRTIYDRIASFI